MTDISLFDPVKLGAWELANRVVMAPMTRSRAEPDWTPCAHAPRYYGQRNNAGMVIAEATQVGPDATGYARTPGIWTDAHVARWREIVDAIHTGPAKALLQLWHCGRIAHPDNMPEGCVPIAPSAVQPKMPIYTDVAGGNVENPMPKAMTEEDIRRVIEDHRKAAANAKEAGFDGVEIHGANGYLVEQFAATNTNKRTDAWGGTLEKRLRFLVEVIEAIAKVYDRSRIGLRLSPFGTFNEIADEDPPKLFDGMLRKAAEARISYVHVIRPRVSGDEDRTASEADTDVVAMARRIFPGIVIAAGRFTTETAIAELRSGRADLIAFGRPFIANPDLIERMKRGIPLSHYNPDHLYVLGEQGYIDHHPLTPAAAASMENLSDHRFGRP